MWRGHLTVGGGGFRRRGGGFGWRWFRRRGFRWGRGRFSHLFGGWRSVRRNGFRRRSSFYGRRFRGSGSGFGSWCGFGHLLGRCGFRGSGLGRGWRWLGRGLHGNGEGARELLDGGHLKFELRGLGFELIGLNAQLLRLCREVVDLGAHFSDAREECVSAYRGELLHDGVDGGGRGRGGLGGRGFLREGGDGQRYGGGEAIEVVDHVERSLLAATLCFFDDDDEHDDDDERLVSG